MRRYYRAGRSNGRRKLGNIEGLRLAADIVERAIETRQPVRRP